MNSNFENLDDNSYSDSLETSCTLSLSESTDSNVEEIEDRHVQQDSWQSVDFGHRTYPVQLSSFNEPGEWDNSTAPGYVNPLLQRYFDRREELNEQYVWNEFDDLHYDPDSKEETKNTNNNQANCDFDVPFQIFFFKLDDDNVSTSENGYYCSDSDCNENESDGES